ncbi:SRPBCC family protein [Saccharopolyspora sp. NPDC002578]
MRESTAGGIVDYQHSSIVRVNADVLFDYLAEVANLPEYFAAMQSAEYTGPNSVYVVAKVEGVRRAGEAWFDVDHQARAMSWRSEGESSYSGRLVVSEAGSDDAEVLVTLSTERADGPGIRAGLEQTLANIKRLVEGSSTETAIGRNK